MALRVEAETPPGLQLTGRWEGRLSQSALRKGRNVRVTISPGRASFVCAKAGTAKSNAPNNAAISEIVFFIVVFSL